MVQRYNDFLTKKMENLLDKMDYLIIFAVIMKEGFTGERSIVLPPMTIETEASDPLVSSLYITDIGYYPNAKSHFRERKEPIGEYVLIYCMEGKGWFSVKGNTYQVHENQFFILPPDCPHAYGADKHRPWTIYWIHFRGEHAAFYSEGSLTPQDIQPAINSRISERNHIFEDIFSTLERNTDLESLRYASSLLHYYLASMRYLRLYRQETSAGSDVIAAAIHFMEEHIEKRLTISDLARFTGFSSSHFSRLFNLQMGQSPLAYFNRMKIDRACQLLLNTDMHINQICHLVGIDDNYYFSRLFSKQMGCSPKQYRNKNGDGTHPEPSPLN